MDDEWHEQIEKLAKATKLTDQIFDELLEASI